MEDVHSLGHYRGKHYTKYPEEVRSLKRDGKLQEAVDLLLKLVVVVEKEATANNWLVAPWYYEQLAIM